MKPETIFLYGPPGAGKTGVGRALARALHLPFVDLDQVVESGAGRSVAEIFAAEGESGFRARERDALDRAVGRDAGVVALGGGSLLAPENRARVAAAGQIVVLEASIDDLISRLGEQAVTRPLLAEHTRQDLEKLLDNRGEHYRSFDRTLDTSGRTVEETVWAVQVAVGAFHVTGMGEGYDVRACAGNLATLGAEMRRRDLHGPVSLVTDRNVGPLYADRAARSLVEAGYAVSRHDLPAGEEHKTADSLQAVWASCIDGGLERRSTVIALGGGVVGDLAGFAAATYLRGIRWVVAPTSLLSMVDASLGGKTGVNLPAGKNLAGSFHAPSLVLADPAALETLPEAEWCNGLAEVVKHGLIADPDLFGRCAGGFAEATGDAETLVRRAMAVKIRVIRDDPFEAGPRERLNLGHTVGHGLERASGYLLSHGEAVSIGLVVEARLADRCGVAQDPGLAENIGRVLRGLGLPTRIPTTLLVDAVIEAMGCDKKRAGGAIRFALPERVGSVRTGVEIPENLVQETLDLSK